MGTIQGPSESVPFGDITDVHVSPDGILVLDRLAGVVSKYDFTGRTVLQFGRHGEGPGELSNLPRSVFGFPNGDVGVVDVGNSRITVWDREGRFVRDLRVPLSEGVPVRAAGLDDGLAVVEFSAPSAARVVGGDLSTRLVLVDSTGAWLRVLHTLEVDAPGAMGATGEVRVNPFPERAVWAVDREERVVAGTTSEYELRTAEGISLIRLEVPARPVTEGMRRQMQRDLRSASSSRNAVEPTLTFPASLPVISKVVVGDEGRFFIERPAAPERQERHRYEIHSSDGRHLGTFIPPQGFDLYGTAGALAIGRVVGEFGVESIALLRVNNWPLDRR